jgi:4-diphosphocytidyl-2-C-methyl-D-erythritol kinase
MTTEMQSMQIQAPAKINLSLRILGRRADGFHEIETFIAPISLYDEIEIEKKGHSIDFQCDDPSIPIGKENLVVRAVEVFSAATGSSAGVAIRLRKRIPHGAGLGGGSSNAASALLALNELFDTQLPREALAKMAESIGSDVPFFIFQSAALCRGRGELVSPQKLPEVFSLLLVKPQFGVPTASAYGRWQESSEISGIRYAAQDFHNHTFVNDLERPVFEKFIFLPRLKMWLLGQPEVKIALMSGSGSTVFAVLKNAADVDRLTGRAKEQLDPRIWTCACETV